MSLLLNFISHLSWKYWNNSRILGRSNSFPSYFYIYEISLTFPSMSVSIMSSWDINICMMYVMSKRGGGRLSIGILLVLLVIVIMLLRRGKQEYLCRNCGMQLILLWHIVILPVNLMSLSTHPYVIVRSKRVTKTDNRSIKMMKHSLSLVLWERIPIPEFIPSWWYLI